MKIGQYMLYRTLLAIFVGTLLIWAHGLSEFKAELIHS